MAGKKYFVVTFLQQPYPYIERYVCVPQSWVTLRPSEPVILVSYPSENPAITRNRVENNEPSNEDWTSYQAEMKYITDEYDDADTWIATKYDDGVADTNNNSNVPPLSSSSADVSNCVGSWNNNLPKADEHLKINSEEPSTSVTTSDHQDKIKQEPFKIEFPKQQTFKRKLSGNETDVNAEIASKTIKTEPVDEIENYSHTPENCKAELYSANPIDQELSPILIDDINDILDMIESSNKKSSSTLNKTCINPLANNYGELAKLLTEQCLPVKKNVNVLSKALESSSQKQSDSEYSEFTIKEEITSPILIDLSDGEELLNNIGKEKSTEESAATQPDTVAPVQPGHELDQPSKSKVPDQNSLNNVKENITIGKENQLARPFETSTTETGKEPEQTFEKIFDTQKLVDLAITYGFLKENDKLTMQDPKLCPVNIEKLQKTPENDKGIMQDPKLCSVDTVKSSMQNTQNVSNEPFKLPQQSIENVNASAFAIKVLVEKDTPHIIISTSDEPESKKLRKTNNGRKQRKNVVQNKPKNALPAETPPNVTIQTQNPLNSLTTSMQRYTNPENQAPQISRTSNRTYAPPLYPQSNSQDLHNMFHRLRYYEQMSEERQQNISKTCRPPPQEPAKTTNRPDQPAERCPNGPKLKGYLLEDPRTGKVFIHPSSPENNAEQRPEHQNYEKNKNTEKNKQTPLNQNNHLRPPERPQDNQFVKASGGTFYPGNQQERLPPPMNMNGNNLRPINPQNPHGVQNSFQPPNYYDSYSQGRRFSPATQDSTYQDPRMQQPVEKPPMMRPGPNDNRPIVPPNFNVGYQNYPPMRNVGDERFSSNPNSFRPYNSYEARMEEWFMSLSQKLDCIYAKLSKL